MATPTSQLSGLRAFLGRAVLPGASALDLLRLVLLGLVLVGTTALAIAVRWSSSPPLEEGDVATTAIKAPRSVTYVSEILTEAERRQAAQDPSTIQLRLEPAVADEQLRLLNEVLGTVTRVREDPALPIRQRLEALQAIPTPKLNESVSNDLLNLADSEWGQVVSEARAVLRRSLERQVIADEVPGLRDRLRDWIRPGLSDAQRTMVVLLASPFVRANVVVDTAATERNRQKARADVQPVRVTIQRGELVIRDGSVVSAADIEKLRQLSPRDRATTGFELLGAVGLAAVLVSLLLAYVTFGQPAIWRGRSMVLAGLVIVVTLVAGRLFFPLHPLVPYAFPIATAAMLLAVLLDAHIAVMVASFLALTLGLIGDGSLELVALYFSMAVGGALIVWRADRFARFLWAGGAIALINLALVVAFRLTSQTLDLATLAQLAGLSLVNGLLSSGLTFVAFSLFGSLFGITTVLQLLELAHPNQPMLRRLAREAPGTYHHSLVVSSLAEAAAEAVGADPLFTRVAVYYHDIGKLSRPYFFIENQANMANVHDELDPRSSAQVILGHVADGISLARRSRLPRRIVEIIQEHHGTTLVRYFYRKAAELDPDVDPADFTYPGPKPQTKESAMIMLADSVEATVRSQFQAGRLLTGNHQVPGDDVGIAISPNDQLGQVVSRIINERLVEGQLDECDLTLKDLRAVRQAFISVLTSIYHPRVDYPPATPALPTQEAPRQAAP